MSPEHVPAALLIHVSPYFYAATASFIFALQVVAATFQGHPYDSLLGANLWLAMVPPHVFVRDISARFGSKVAFPENLATSAGSIHLDGQALAESLFEMSAEVIPEWLISRFQAHGVDIEIAKDAVRRLP